jgi:hypothetical protein
MEVVSLTIFDGPLIAVSNGALRRNDSSCSGILAGQPSQKRDTRFPNTKQAMVRVSHELHRNSFMMSNLRLATFHGTRDA